MVPRSMRLEENQYFFFSLQDPAFQSEKAYARRWILGRSQTGYTLCRNVNADSITIIIWSELSSAIPHWGEWTWNVPAFIDQRR
jgi:hypothetical protein